MGMRRPTCTFRSQITLCSATLIESVSPLGSWLKKRNGSILCPCESPDLCREGACSFSDFFDVCVRRESVVIRLLTLSRRDEGLAGFLLKFEEWREAASWSASVLAGVDESSSLSWCRVFLIRLVRKAGRRLWASLLLSLLVMDATSADDEL